MPQFGLFDNTLQVTTGNFRTALDLFDSTQLNNKAQNTLGSIWCDAPTTISNPNGTISIYKYVRYNSATNPAVVASPGPVYYTDATFQVVSGTMADGIGANANSVAGWLMPNTTDMSTLTNLKLNGNFVWICIGGFLSQAIAPAATAIGDAIIGAAGNFTNARVAAGTAPTNKVLGWALTAVAAGKADYYVPWLLP